MPKERVPINVEVSADLLFANDQTCCVCNKPGLPVQIHHMDDNPANNAPDNLSVLCLLCHDQTQIKGGFGRKLGAAVVRKHKEDWQKRVLNRRDQADAVAIGTKSDPLWPVRSTDDDRTDENEWRSIPADPVLVAYVMGLPSVLESAYRRDQPRMDTGITFEMVDGAYSITDVVVQMMVHLSEWFPKNHFGGMPAQRYFSRYQSERANWHLALDEPGGPGTGGTILGVLISHGVLHDMKTALQDLVRSLLWGTKGFYWRTWVTQWAQAAEYGSNNNAIQNET